MALSEAHFFQVVLYLICRKCRHVFESRFRCLFHRPWLDDGEGVYTPFIQFYITSKELNLL